MALTQESILFLLLAEGGQVKKSDLLDKFRDAVDCVDPAQKERNRELFKTFVNNLAFVKEVDGVRYVVLKKTYRHLLENAERNVEKTESAEDRLTGEQQRPPAWTEGTGSCEDVGGGRSAAREPAPKETGDGENPAEGLSPIQEALQRSSLTSTSVKRMLSFDVRKQDTDKDPYSRRGEIPPSQSKRYALPLRMPPSVSRVEIRKLKADPEDPPESPRQREALPSVEVGDDVSVGVGSTQLRRSVKGVKAPEEAKDAQVCSSVPLEQSEHQWLVKCAAGHWSQVYGLLLRDNQLAEKRDFMSGFTALHWAAKCGNSEMLVKIVDLSRQGGVDVNVNVRTHGGYTPLHIAALHNQQYVMGMLVKEFGANTGIRDYCGKKAYHYLPEGAPESVREMLGEPRAPHAPDRSLPEKEELELFPDLSKGLHSISRLFQANVPGHKKKHKQRPGLYSLSDSPSEEPQDSTFRHRLASELFMYD